MAIDDEIRVRHDNAYIYTKTQYPSQVAWTLGLSFDRLQDKTIGDPIEVISPKLGFMWDITPNTILRSAAFRGLKRSLLNDQTIEPTQVAGFNQNFDDFNGTESWRYGIALDQKFTQDLFGGVEASYRDLKTPLAFSGKDKWNEQLYRAYINWALNPSIALDLEYRFEKFQRQERGGLDDVFPRTESHVAPMGISFFHPSGFFSRLGVTYVHQNVKFFTESASGRNDFFLLDVGLGYRLPKRYGIISFTARNLFNQDFLYQGDHRRTSRDVVPQYQSGRTLLGQITLAF